jgi:DNA (cytosine-5)-methyltransferase 1
MTQVIKPTYNVVDLFAGAGGLSCGFLQTGRYKIKAAFESDEYAKQTYKQNHSEALIYNDVADALTEETKSKLGKIDLVIGGPPCQGFSNANRQKNNAISQNNSLVKKYVQAVINLNPTAFVMENVSMLQSKTHRFYVDNNDEGVVAKYGIRTTPSEILLLDSAHLFNGVEDIVKEKNKIDNYIWAEKNYLLLNIIYKKKNTKDKLIKALDKYKKKLLILADELINAKNENNSILREGHVAGRSINEYFAGDHTLERAIDLCLSLEPSIMYQRMLSKSREIHENQISVSEFQASAKSGLIAKVNSMAITDYIESILGASQNGYLLTKGVLSAADFGVPQKRSRFVMIGVKKDLEDPLELPTGTYSEANYFTVRDAISDLEDIETLQNVNVGDKGIDLNPIEKISPLGKRLRNSTRLYNNVTTLTTDEALKRFKTLEQGQNFHDLPEKLKKSYSDSDRTQNTIYLRVVYDKPSGTVVNIRKSMWIHPVKDRALSIREAARLQSFPDSFIFKGTKDSQYQQVGNAVPPILAQAIAEHLCKYLDQKSSCDLAKNTIKKC